MARNEEELPFSQPPAQRPPDSEDPPFIGEGTAKSMADIVDQGKIIAQTKTNYQTAVAVLKPRDLVRVCARVEQEAQVAGDSFYYAMTYLTKKGPVLIEGPSIEMAMCIIRNFGNCVLHTDVREDDRAFFFTPTFIDLETGFNFSRTKRVLKGGGGFGKFDVGRKEEIKYEKGQSIAIRNVALKSVPNWIVDKAMKISKGAAIAFVAKLGRGPALKELAKCFAQYGIETDRVEAKMGKKAPAWDEQDMARLFGGMQALADGQETAEEMFPALDAYKKEAPEMGDGRAGDPGTGDDKGGKAKK
jgi:hypothetical protein